MKRWAVTYETATLRVPGFPAWHDTEAGAWAAYDKAVIDGLDPDRLAVVEAELAGRRTEKGG